KGMASTGGAGVEITGGGIAPIAMSLPDHDVAGSTSQSINDKAGPEEGSGTPGKLCLHAHWRLAADHPRALLGKSASAEFAPDPALDPLWVGGPRDPFHGAAKKDFGFQIVVKVEADAAAK